MENRYDPLLLLLLAIPVLFVALGANSIWDANEAYYVETPKQMVISGDYVNPSFNGQPRFNKPVLSYWIVAALYKTIGTSVTTERVGIAIGALGIIVAAVLIGRAFGGALTGALSGIVIATAPHFILHARRIFIDIYITLFMALTLACLVLAERYPSHRRRYLLLMYVAVGLGALTKGPIAIVLPFIAVCVWLALERRLGDLKRLMIVPGAIIVLAIVVPWYAAVYQQHGWTYIWTFLGGENIGRYFGNSPLLGSAVPANYLSAPPTEGRGPFFYLPVLFLDLFPWAPLLLVPIVVAWRRRSDGDTQRASIRRLLWSWVVVIVAIFSFSQSKQDLYILPVVPALAALVAETLISSGYGRSSAPVRVILGSISVVCVLLGVAVAWLFHSGYFALTHATLAGVVLGATGVASLVLQLANRRAQAVVALAGGFVVFNYVFVMAVLPDVERLKPVPKFVEVYDRGHDPNARIGSYGVLLPSFVFYTGKALEDVGSLDQAEAFFRDPSEGWMMIGEAEWAALQTRITTPCVKASHPLFDAKGDDLLHGAPPRDVLLVSSRCR